MYTVLNERWLAQYNQDSNICTIRDLDSTKFTCYSGVIDKAMATLIYPSLVSAGESTHDKKVRIELNIAEDEASVQFIATVILKNGLELRPIKSRLVSDTSQPPKSQILELVSYTNEIESRLNQSNHELAMTQKIISNITSDQQDFEELVLKRVSEILIDRNEWIQKHQNVKRETKFESTP